MNEQEKTHQTRMSAFTSNICDAGDFAGWWRWNWTAKWMKLAQINWTSRGTTVIWPQFTHITNCNYGNADVHFIVIVFFSFAAIVVFHFLWLRDKFFKTLKKLKILYFKSRPNIPIDKRGKKTLMIWSLFKTTEFYCKACKVTHPFRVMIIIII